MSILISNVSAHLIPNYYILWSRKSNYTYYVFHWRWIHLIKNAVLPIKILQYNRFFFKLKSPWNPYYVWKYGILIWRDFMKNCRNVEDFSFTLRFFKLELKGKSILNTTNVNFKSVKYFYFCISFSNKKEAIFCSVKSFISNFFSIRWCIVRTSK